MSPRAQLLFVSLGVRDRGAKMAMTRWMVHSKPQNDAAYDVPKYHSILAQNLLPSPNSHETFLAGPYRYA
ncbi:hypothetical protein AG1IA_00680 [Rhizoctonia solani AG-1 IA]|uniref:Uncharacterized protein n=1 Tax=Thanatephorus cucumeris (strain AG1-IA) TaxID=983506 RepID=L8X893_THACA|nr:hypothetical protein AG1IA_00680 [Rhizoctonia solani AG-1 IA]